LTLLIALLILLLLLLGAPLFICLGALAYLLLTSVGLEPQVIAIEIYRITSSPNLIVIPLFAFAGVLMARSRMPHRMVELARATFGWLPGGAAIITLLSFEFFTAFTGASGISILATGGMLYHVLRGAGYSDRFSLGLISSAGSLGVLLPPSIVIIFYGTLTRAPIDVMFKAGLLPSAVMLTVLGGYCLWQGRLNLSREPFRLERFREALWAAKLEVPLPLLVLGGIYSGVITVTEAACVSSVYVLISEVVVHREIHWRRDLPGVALEAMTLVGAIIVVLGVALGLTNYLVDQGLPERLLEFSASYITTRVQFLLALNLLLLIAGCLLDVFSALILLVPLVTPLAVQFGVDPIHLGIIFLANLEIGYSTPPVGLNLFVSSLTFHRPLPQIIRSVVPFVLLLLVAVLIITFVPWLSTWPVQPTEDLLLAP